MDSFFGDPYMMWHDGIDPTSAKALRGEERDKAEEMLIESMKEGSYWAPMGLREMKSERAIPFMKNLIKQSQSRLLIEIAHALNVLENTTEYIPYILDVLKNHPFWSSRMDAALLLRKYSTPEVVDALFDSILDEDYLVRNHSCESILHIHNLPSSISEYKDIFSEIIVDYNAEEESGNESLRHYKNAAELLRKLILNETRKKSR